MHGTPDNQKTKKGRKVGILAYAVEVNKNNVSQNNKPISMTSLQLIPLPKMLSKSEDDMAIRTRVFSSYIIPYTPTTHNNHNRNQLL